MVFLRIEFLRFPVQQILHDLYCKPGSNREKTVLTVFGKQDQTKCLLDQLLLLHPELQLYQGQQDGNEV